jgi:dGTPase
MKKNLDGYEIFDLLDNNLADFAQKNSTSRGRKFREIPDPQRGPFQRDRDRILHSTAFRRLAGKMQVVSPGHGDHFRNRLTHTLEVAQISRDLARQLHLNEDLAKAIALAHDLGHPPFGHSGETALDEKMREFSVKNEKTGEISPREFEHNEQSLRIVEVFEKRYTNFRGLNLTYEVLEGMQKHSTFFDRPDEEFIFSPHLESQIVDIADEIAYLSADIEDGLRGGFFTINDLDSLEICHEARASLVDSEKNFRSAIIRRIMRNLIVELVRNSRENITKFKIKNIEHVQKCSSKVISFSDQYFAEFLAVKDFLMKNYYSAPVIRQATEEGQKIIKKVFDFLIENPAKLPEYLQNNDDTLEVKVCDYIAGMTDSFVREFAL